MARFKARCLVTQVGNKFRIKVIDGPGRNVSKPSGQVMIRETVLLRPCSFDSRAQKCIYEPSVSKNNFYKIIGVLSGIGDYKNHWVEANLELMVLSHDGIKWEVSIEDAEPITGARFNEEETDMSKKEINEESYAREAAAAIKKGMQEWKQYHDQMRAPVPPAIMDIKFNGPATIIFWGDGTKTVAKQNENEPYFDKEKAIAMAVLKKLYPGNAYHMLFNLDVYFRKQLKVAEKKRDSILSQIKDARKPKVTSRLEQELYKIDDEIARLKKEVEKFE